MLIPKAVLIDFLMDNTIEISGIDRLECQINTEVNNIRWTKSLFSR